MKITKLTKQKKSDRYNLFVDDKYMFSVPPELIIEYSLSRGVVLEESLLEELSLKGIEVTLRSQLLNFLSYRPRTESEVKKRACEYAKKHKMFIAQKQYDQVVDRIIKSFVDAGLVNDEQFAKSYVDELLRSKKGYSKRMVIKKLYEKGLSKDLVDRYIYVYNADVELNNALKLLSRRVKDANDLKDKQKRNKIYRYLTGKGYSYDVINKAVSTFKPN